MTCQDCKYFHRVPDKYHYENGIAFVCPETGKHSLVDWDSGNECKHFRMVDKGEKCAEGGMLSAKSNP